MVSRTWPRALHLTASRRCLRARPRRAPGRRSRPRRASGPEFKSYIATMATRARRCERSLFASARGEAGRLPGPKWSSWLFGSESGPDFGARRAQSWCASTPRASAFPGESFSTRFCAFDRAHNRVHATEGSPRDRNHADGGDRVFGAEDSNVLGRSYGRRDSC